MRGKYNIIFGLIVIGLFMIPLVMAFEWNFVFGNLSVNELFQNEWVLFGIVFAIIFTSLFYIVKDKTDNSPVSVIVGGGLALLITIPIMRRGILDAIVGEATGGMITLILFGIGLLAILYWLFKKFSFKGAIAALGLIFIIPVFLDLEKILPEQIMYGAVGDAILILKGFGNLVVTIYLIVLILWILWRVRGLFKKKSNVGNTNQTLTQQTPVVKGRLNKRQRWFKYKYKPGMKRGGNNRRRGRFVSKKAVEEYARMYGMRAAKKRFKLK